MKFLIDTDVLIDSLKDQNPPISLFKLTSTAELSISIITWIETTYGIRKRSPMAQKRMDELNTLLKKLNMEVCNIDKDIADKFIGLKILQEKKGYILEDFDFFVASTALAYNLTLVTRNIKHFSRIKGLKLYKSPQTI